MAWELDDWAMDLGTILVACSHYMMICGSHCCFEHINPKKTTKWDNE
jgi:hypothetical protein